MAKQKTVKEENIVKETITNQNDVNNTIEDTQREETIIEEDHKEDNSISIPETIVEEKNTPIEEKKKNTIGKNTASNKVRSIIQKRPSTYSLLMEDGRSVVVHKSMFDKNNMVILSDE